jgi:N-acetylneuraminate synthase/N,N'-diacetyllegionaminate synthase
MKIANFDLDKKVLIVAEIGNNHEGDARLAERLIALAASSGADAVKFQTIVPSRLVAPAQKERLEQLERFRLSYKDFEKLGRVAKREGVIFLSTPFDTESVRFLDGIVPAFKIASADNNFLPMIEALAKTGKPVILSGGLAGMDEIEKTVDFIKDIWRSGGMQQELAVLHCVSSYPVKPEEANLLAIRTMRERLGVTVGYSDHTMGIEAAVLSVALGARIVEKHFTLDKGYSGFRDHSISADPEDLKALVNRIRQASKMMGSGIKEPQESEGPAIRTIRRSIVANRPLKKGKIIKYDDLTWLRSERGLPFGRESDLLGRALKRPIKQGEPILTDDTTVKMRRR